MIGLVFRTLGRTWTQLIIVDGWPDVKFGIARAARKCRVLLDLIEEARRQGGRRFPDAKSLGCDGSAALFDN